MLRLIVLIITTTLAVAQTTTPSASASDGTDGAANPPLPSEPLRVENCHLHSMGCNLGFPTSWDEATKEDAAAHAREEASIHAAPSINILKRNTTSLSAACDPLSTIVLNQCGPNGKCDEETKICKCDEFYIHELLNYSGQDIAAMNNTIFVYPCNYQATSKKLIFFLSLFLGLCGCDWCWLSVGVNSAYVCLGCFKFLTMGGFGIWWVYDVLALYFGNGPADGWGFELYDDLTNTGVPTGLTSLPVSPEYVNGL
jgi:hypothetical protein